MKNIILYVLSFLCGIFFRYLWVEESSIIDAVIIIVFLTGAGFWMIWFAFGCCKFIDTLLLKFKGGKSG